MRRFLCVVVILFFGFAPCSYADSIPFLNVNITYVTVSLGPNDGLGENAFITMIGPGTRITAIAGMACFDWCYGPIPNLNSVFVSQVFVASFTGATVDGVSYDPNSDFSINCCLFSDGGDLNGSASGFVGEGPTFANMNLNLPSGGGWHLNFEPVDGGYQFVQGEFTAGTPSSPVPEPGMLSLMVTGLASIFSVVRKRI